MRIAPLLLALGACGVLATSTPAHEGSFEVVEVEPPLLFEPPAPGTYTLPPIRRVVPRSLLDTRGRPSELPGLRPDQVGVIAFVYRSCVDAEGCPLALAALRRLDRKLTAHPELASRVRLVTVSFDPARDSPARMAELRAHLDPTGDWRFLTAPNEAAIAPVLSTFGQDALRRIDPGGQETGLIGHVLKVFLVDGDRWVRNVYSAGFLDARILLNDIETVLAER